MEIRLNKPLKIFLWLFIIVILIPSAFIVIRDLLAERLWYAVRNNNVSYVQHYLEKGGEVDLTKDIPASDGKVHDYTLLMEAANHGSIEVAIVLLKHKANVNAVTSFNTTPLIYAARGGNPALIKLLIDHGADINWDESAPLAQAVFYGHIDAIKALLDARSRITDQAINLATYSDRKDILQLLIDHGAKITQKEIDWALEANKPEIAEFLKKHR